MGSDGDFDELTSKGGQGVQTLESNHGWNKVVNTKKAKRQHEARVKSGVRNAGNNAAETRIFQALVKEAGQKKALQEALLRSYQQDLAASFARPTLSDSSDDAEAKTLVFDTDLEKKPKIKKQKKPKVTVVEAASSIDAADLASFLDLVHIPYVLCKYAIAVTMHKESVQNLSVITGAMLPMYAMPL